jgi:hypothetical protein
VAAAAAAGDACGVGGVGGAGGWVWALAGPRIAAATRTAPPGPPHSPEEGLWCPFSLASHGRRTPLSAKTDYRLPLSAAAGSLACPMVERRGAAHPTTLPQSVHCTDALSHLA